MQTLLDFPLRSIGWQVQFFLQKLFVDPLHTVENNFKISERSANAARNVIVYWSLQNA